jgi:TM2 domain-containing membrane protein YozV
MDDSPSLSLGLTPPTSAPSPMFPPQPVPRNPAIAFLLSLIFPGAGQIYCDKTSRGLWTLAIFFPSLAATVYFTRQLGRPDGEFFGFFWGIVLRITVFLYVFAFLDAFFTAREMTAGTDAFIAESPRVAAILNLLTRGFGYFYLGKRTLGFAVFFGLGIFQSVITQSTTNELSAGRGFFLELVQIGLAAHAYQMARERERQILATVQLPPSLVSARQPAAIPVAFSLLLVAGYFAVAASGLFLPSYASIDQSTARVSQKAQRTTYDNPAYGVSLAVPGLWTVEHREPTYLALAIREDHACSADLRPFPWSFLLGLDSYKRQLDYQLSQDKSLTAKILDDKPVFLSGLPARDIYLSVRRGMNSLVEHRIIAKKGMTLYVLATYQLAAGGGAPADPSCSSDLQFIRDNLRLPH